MALRLIKDQERNLIEHLLSIAGVLESYSVPTMVEDLDDGGMGSIQLSKKGRHFGELVLVEYYDADQQLVLIGLSKNQHGELFDLDFWKVDFNPIIRYPMPKDLKLVLS